MPNPVYGDMNTDGHRGDGIMISDKRPEDDDEKAAGTA
jgi:hypothetical protein